MGERELRERERARERGEAVRGGDEREREREWSKGRRFEETQGPDREI